MGITRAQIARQLLAQGGMSLNDAQMMAPDGEFLAYINPKEAQMLKDAGGSGIMTPMGIPSYMNLGNEQQMNENLSAAGGGRGGSQNQTGGDTDDIYQQSSNTNQAIAKANRSIGQKIVDSIKNVSNFTPFGIARKGLGFLFDKFQNLRGGLTQKQFEDARRERQKQNRIANIMGRDAPFTAMTLENLKNLGYTGPLDGLIGTTNVTRSGTSDGITNTNAANDLVAEQLSFPYDFMNTGDPYKDNLYAPDGTYKPGNNTLLAKVDGPALIQMRRLEKQAGMEPLGGKPMTEGERNALEQLKQMDADPNKIYTAPISIV